MDYKHLSAEQQRGIVTSRLQALEAEHLNTTVVLAELQANADAGDTSAETAKEVDRLTANLGIIDLAHGAAEAELAKLPEVEA